MIFSIHQPCYFPWLGLLYKIASSEVLIILDDVQLSDSAFQHRNQFLTIDGNVKYLTIPFVKQNYINTPFKELKIANNEWSHKHNNFLVNNYKKHPFFDQIYPEIQPLFMNKTSYLIDIVMESMRMSIKLFGLSTKIIMQSQTSYDRSAKKADLVIELLRATNAKSYLSGKGAVSYQDEGSFALNGIALCYAEFEHPTYVQKNSTEFVPGLSSLDFLFNVGSNQATEALNLRRCQ